MKLIPSAVFKFPSHAENTVYDLLSKVEMGNDWVGLHSLNCSEHEYKQWSEIDFLLVGAEGLFVLEVKGGAVSYTDGVWRYTNRFGKVRENNEGPFNQAKSARFALENVIIAKSGLTYFESKPVYGFGVVFPDIPWKANSPEMPREIVADRYQCESHEAFAKYLQRLRNYWKGKLPGAKGFTAEDRRRTVQFLRPNIDVYPPFTLRLGEVKKQMQTLTDEQYERLDILEANHQAIVSGGAGTGKTFLLIQAARREIARGRSVLVATESAILAAYLRKLVPDRELRIACIADLEPSPTRTADVLFVDEGQDLLSYEALEVLGSQLSGGLEEGCWRWFMDENNQSRLRGQFSEDVLELIKQGLGRQRPVYLPLRQNVRNTREIITTVETWTGANIGRTQVTGHGEPPTVIPVGDLGEAIRTLEARFERFEELVVELDQVAVICTSGQGRSVWAGLTPRWRRKTVPLDVTTVSAGLSDKAVVGSVADFKGLERPIVIVIDVEAGAEAHLWRALMYVGSTRANYDLTVLTNRPKRFMGGSGVGGLRE